MVGLREGVHIWIPGQEPTFLPGECEQMGPSESYEEAAGCLLPRYNRTHSAGTLVGPEGPESHMGTWFGSRIPPMQIAEQVPRAQVGSGPLYLREPCLI